MNPPDMFYELYTSIESVTPVSEEFIVCIYVCIATVYVQLVFFF